MHLKLWMWKDVVRVMGRGSQHNTQIPKQHSEL